MFLNVLNQGQQFIRFYQKQERKRLLNPRAVSPVSHLVNLHNLQIRHECSKDWSWRENSVKPLTAFFSRTLKTSLCTGNRLDWYWRFNGAKLNGLKEKNFLQWFEINAFRTNSILTTVVNNFCFHTILIFRFLCSCISIFQNLWWPLHVFSYLWPSGLSQHQAVPGWT